MKKILLLLIILTSNSLFSQTYNSNAGLINFNLGNKFEEAEITYTDNTKLKGFINGFIENNSIEFGSDSGFSSLEHQLNIDDKKFYFKNNTEDKPIVLSQDKIKSISILNNAKTYYLLKLKSVDKNKNIIDLNRKVWLPLLNENDEFKIFGFNLFVNNRYVYTYTYLSNDNEFALKATDKIFTGRDELIESYQIMIKYIFKNCEKLNPLIDDFTNLEKQKKNYADLQAQIKTVKKNKNLSKDEEKNQILELNQNFFTEPYLKMIEEYKKSCK